MRSRWHLITAFCFFVLLYFVMFPRIRISEIVFPIVVCTFPDVDLHFGVHRSFLTHSILIPFIVYFFNFYMIFILFIMSISLHLLCDVKFNKNKMRGYYTIKLGLWRKGLKGWSSTIWMLVNGIIGIGFGITILIIFGG